MLSILFFFFQAEDGIRDGTVTGVQTCALPIYRLRDRRAAAAVGRLDHERPVDLQAVDRQPREVAEARVAGAEVVHRDLHPERLELPEDGNRFLAVVDQ